MFLSFPELLISFSSGTMAAAILLVTFSPTRQIFQRKTQREEDKRHIFTFENQELVGCSEIAKQAISVTDTEDDIYNHLVDRLARIFPDLPKAIEVAGSETEELSFNEATKSGPVNLSVRLSGTAAEFTISGIDAPLAHKIILDRDLREAEEAELQILRDVVSVSPLPVWRQNAKGQVDWANHSYRQLVDKAVIARDNQLWPLPQIFETGAIAKTGEMVEPARNMLELISGDNAFFETHSFAHQGSTYHFGSDANALVSAETSLRNFMHTLTQTFAYLSIGLAVFDKSRHLVMFNPALADLTFLKPEYLSTRPVLYDFLNALREKRILPERRDFSDWRRKMTELEQGASNGTYSETWTLTSGQTYRMMGKPHPEGAIAFIIEDITAEISLTRKFRKELALSQSVFDAMTEAMAVFSVDGHIIISNAAYSDLWGVNPNESLAQISVQDACRDWLVASEPSPIWGDLREFVIDRTDRVEWSAAFRHQSGRQILCHVTPLPKGATLVTFTPLSETSSNEGVELMTANS